VYGILCVATIPKQMTPPTAVRERQRTTFSFFFLLVSLVLRMPPLFVSISQISFMDTAKRERERKRERDAQGGQRERDTCTTYKVILVKGSAAAEACFPSD
jgi:hypothetical protein